MEYFVENYHTGLALEVEATNAAEAVEFVRADVGEKDDHTYHVTDENEIEVVVEVTSATTFTLKR